MLLLYSFGLKTAVVIVIKLLSGQFYFQSQIPRIFIFWSNYSILRLISIKDHFLLIPKIDLNCQTSIYLPHFMSGK